MTIKHAISLNCDKYEIVIVIIKNLTIIIIF